VVEPLLAAASVGVGTRVLDVATGPGWVAAQAAERGASVVGVDVAEAMIARARSAHPQLDFRRADAHELPFPDASFDAVVGNFAIMHLSRHERAVAQWARVLRPGGRLALTAWAHPSEHRLVGVFLDAVAEARAMPPADLPPGRDFFRFSDDEELAAVLRQQDLASPVVTGITFMHRFGNARLWRPGGTRRRWAFPRASHPADQEPTTHAEVGTGHQSTDLELLAQHLHRADPPVGSSLTTCDLASHDELGEHAHGRSRRPLRQTKQRRQRPRSGFATACYREESRGHGDSYRRPALRTAQPNREAFVLEEALEDKRAAGQATWRLRRAELDLDDEDASAA
jgi:SAM-dependent methyltransferase